MYKTLLFGGTSEGRIIAEKLCDTLVCVATEYGGGLVRGADVLVKRCSSDEIKSLIKKHGTETVIDATHPYAVEVTRNIKKACGEFPDVKYIRIVRENKKDERCLYFETTAQITEFLKKRSGNIFIATGSKNIEDFMSLGVDRLFVRTLPSVDVVKKCTSLGIKNLICMRGPFSRELNRAMFRGMDYIVTKDSGQAGGFSEKTEAAADVGARVLVLKRPAEEGITLEEFLAGLDS